MAHCKIVSRFEASKILYEGEAESLKDLIGTALKAKADLRGADLRGYKVKQAAVFTGLYTYTVISFVTEGGEHRIALGCYNRSVAEWEADFWNNLSEFPNDGSIKSRERLFAFNVAKQWLKQFAEKE
jgi:hypothetical protein